MERRKFLGWGGASLASLSAYPWLAACSNEPESKLTTTSKPVTSSPVDPIDLDFKDCVARARSLGKPVLLFVAPPRDDRFARPAPSQTFAEFLSNADDDLWSILALCELACASPEEIRAVIPSSKLDGSELLAIIEHESPGPIIAATMSSPSEPDGIGYASPRDFLQRRFGDWITQLRQAIVPDAAALKRRVDAARSAIGTLDCQRVDECIASSDDPKAAWLANASALFLQAAAAEPKKCGEFHRLVVEEIRERVLARGFSGAGWGKNTGCCNIEEAPNRRKPRGSEGDPERIFFLCGIAYTGGNSSRFLWFYTDENR